MSQGFSDATNWPPRPLVNTGAAGTAPFPSTGPHGHRHRMRERLLARGAATLADYEVLEMLLFLGIPRRDTKPAAKATINLFGSLPAVLRATRDRLLAVPDMTPACAEAIALVQASSAKLAASEARDAPVLSNWASLRAYLAQASPAALRVLYLDNKNRLLADEAQLCDVLNAGAIRVILRRALERHSVSLLLAAWRADAAVTRADGETLSRLRAAGAAVSVGVHDLVLVAADELTSVQQETG
jgi:DNA repair protein RadC